MSATDSLPYELGGPVRTSAQRDDLQSGATARRAPFCSQAEAEGFRPGSKEHSHRVSRLDGGTYDCGCAGCRQVIEDRSR